MYVYIYIYIYIYIYKGCRVQGVGVAGNGREARDDAAHVRRRDHVPVSNLRYRNASVNGRTITSRFSKGTWDHATVE